MVASGQPNEDQQEGRRFNPLHCGAVVASRRRRRMAGSGGAVSIPFIAGQWSLRRKSAHDRKRPTAFQSPSLRGSGRFRSTPPPSGARRTGVSIPFIAGQWSLRGKKREMATIGRKFQSPSLRGSGRFHQLESLARLRSQVSIPFIAGQWSLHQVGGRMGRQPESFNPLHCGAVVASGPGPRAGRS